MGIKTLLPLFVGLAGLVAQSLQTIFVTQPAVTPFANNQIEYWYSNFGVIHYNKPMPYAIYATNSTFCDDEQDKKIQHFKQPTYLVVSEAGGCSFTKKALKAQDLGAQGILFGSSEIDYAVEGTVLADDGYGRKVKIAVLFISPQDMEALGNLKNPRIKVNFPIRKTMLSQVSLFLSAGSRQSYIFLRDFKQYYLQAKDQIKLSPVYHTFECQYCDESECVLQKQCCSYDMEYFSPGKGRYIVQEQFRQYRIFRYFSEQQQVEKWFDYMNAFDLNCDNDWVNSEACSKRILESLGVRGKLQLIDEFDVMMAWRRDETRTGIFSYPDISVNGVRHSETLTAATSFAMICDSLTSPPDSCSNAIKPSPGNKTGVIIGIVVAILLLIGSGIYCYRKVIRREITNDMSSRVNELVAKYASKVSEQKKKRKDKLMEKMTEEL